MRHLKTIRNNIFKGLEIYTNKNITDGSYMDILKSIYDAFEYMTSKYSRVMLIRFDVRFPQSYYKDDSNRHISHLFKMITDNSKYRHLALQYIWVRERSDANHQHYHCMILANGHKIQCYYSFLKKIERQWTHVLNLKSGEGLVHFCDNNGLMIRKPLRNSIGYERRDQEKAFSKAYEDAFYRCSYLAKVSTKTDRLPPNVRRYNSSLRR